MRDAAKFNKSNTSECFLNATFKSNIHIMFKNVPLTFVQPRIFSQNIQKLHFHNLMGTLAKHVFVNLEIANSEPYFCDFVRFLRRLNLGAGLGQSPSQIPTNLPFHKMRVILTL